MGPRPGPLLRMNQAIRLGVAATLCYAGAQLRGAAHAMFARLWNALRREPLVHFLALAALLFVAYHLLRPSARESIVIDQPSIDGLARRQEELLARPLRDEERRALVEIRHR